MELAEGLKRKIAHYQPSADAAKILQKAHVVLLVAISGGGKDTIKHHLLQTGKYHHIISYTTRTPRANDGTLEQDGVDYHFIDAARAEQLLGDGAFIETDVYAGNIYGTGIVDIVQSEREGKIATTDITLEGALDYLRVAPSVKAVFLLPPSFETWMQRLSGRGEHTKHDLRLRMREAVEELEHAMQSDQMYIVVNDDLQKTVQLVDDIAHDQPVEPHYHKAMEIAEHLTERLQAELAKPD